MKATDLRVRAVDITFSDVTFRTPLKLSTGSISAITYANVEVEAENREGRTARGKGAILLSDLWAFPSERVGHDERDRAMRRVSEVFGERLKQLDRVGDPLQLGMELEHELPAVLQEVSEECGLADPLPTLAGLVCLAPWDAALHDVWGLLAELDTYAMYTAEYLNSDLEAYLGSGFRGRYPGDFLRESRSAIPVQHAVGGGDVLRKSDERSHDPQDGIPNSLEGWIERDRVYWQKLKVTGNDLKADLDRIVAVYDVAAASAHRLGIPHEVQMEIDPNEGCRTPDYLVELLNTLRERSPAAFRALKYVEQPTGRDLAEYTFTLHEASKVKPVVIDESLHELDNLERLEPLGWSGVALKSCKGQTHTLLAYCWARQNNRFVSLQDLTNPGIALVHSAQLARRLHLSAECLEYNSRQFIPDSCPDEREGYESIFTVQDGEIRFGPKGPGLY